MDKIALSKRLSGFSEVFKKDTKFARDLKAMSMVIENLPEDKFASLIIEAEDAKAEDAKAEDAKAEDKKSEETKEAAKKPAEEKAEEKPAEEEAEEEAEEKGESEEEEETEKSAGLYWNKQASEAVLSFLKKDVIGEEVKSVKNASEDLVKKASAEPVPAAKLPASQAPDGKGDKPAPTLKKDQVPHISEVLKSNMVEKSHGAVRKEASESGTKFISEGIELTASMDEVDLDSAEMKKLSQLFG